MKILNFGSLNIDYVYQVDHMVKRGETLSSGGRAVFTGGKGLNQSIALARAGLPVWHAGNVGRDGDLLLKELKDSGVDTSLVRVLSDQPSGHTVIQNDKEGDNCILLYGGANQAVTEEEVDAVLSHFSAGDWLVLQNEINELPYIIRRAKDKGMRIVLNPSPMNEKILDLPLEDIELFFINEIEAVQLIQGLEEKTEQKVTRRKTDMDRYFSETDGPDWKKIRLALLDLLPKGHFVLTMGSFGAVYFSKEEALYQPAEKVKAVDTTAAGDTFTGYFLAGILGAGEKRTIDKDNIVARETSRETSKDWNSSEESMDQDVYAPDRIQNSLALASHAAAIAVTRHGAAPSIPSLKEVETGI
ncbi:ribokinase [Lachnospiraceae bacterium YH-ros2228]